MNQTIDIERAANILKLMGDKTRLTILRILLDHECCVCEFVEIFQTSQPAISQHIRKLKDAGLVKETRRGQWIIYYLNENYEQFSYLKLLLASLPSQEDKLEELERQGKRISCE